MVRIKNTDTATSLEVTVIREIVTIIAPNEEKEVAIDPQQERMEIKSAS